MEQGMFQDFCLYFLALYDSKYLGIERHVATADGKTRKVHQALLKH